MSTGASTLTACLTISGHVQGVGFRKWTKRVADQHGLNGWVRNRLDGTVEALFQGPAQAVDDAIERCRKGPRSSRVDTVDVTVLEASDLLGEFTVRPTE
jgi:acylphosphatase